MTSMTCCNVAGTTAWIKLAICCICLPLLVSSSLPALPGRVLNVLDVAAMHELQTMNRFTTYNVSQKNPPPPRGLDIFHIFHKWPRIFNQFFTHLLYVPIYARLQIFIQLSPILTKLCHIKRDYPVHIMCAKCPPSAKTHAFRRLCKSLIALLIVVYGKSV